MMRAIVLAAAAGLVLAMASPADAAPLRLRGKATGSVYVPPPPPPDITVTLRQTQDVFVPMKAWLDIIPAENDITCTVAGPIRVKVEPISDPARMQTSGALTYVKRQLYPFFDPYTSNVVASSSGASVGSAVGTFTCSAKAGILESGATSTHVVTFDVTNQPDLNYSIGVNSRARYGGPALSDLPGTVGNKSITACSLSPSCPVEIATETNRLALKGTYGSTTKTFPVTDGQTWTVTVHDSALSQDWVYNFTAIGNRSSVAPRPGTDTVTASQLITVLTSTDPCFGMNIVSEDGAYPGLNMQVSTTSPAACAATPGLTAPTSPYAEGWAPYGLITSPPTANAGIITANPAFISIFCRTPRGCDMGVSTSFSIHRAAGNAYYLHFANIKGTIYPTVNFPGTFVDGFSWLMVSHLDIVSATVGNSRNLVWNGAKDYASNLFMVETYGDGLGITNSDGSGGAVVTINGRDSQIVRPTFTNTSSDRISWFTYNALPGVEKSFLVWAEFKNQRTYSVAGGACAAHIDNVQTNLGTPSLYRSLPAGSLVDMGSVIGNLAWRGAGDYNLSLQACAGASEQWFIGNSGGTTSRSDLVHTLKFVGNFTNDINAWGFALMTQSSQSILANNMNTYGYEVLADKLAGTGPNAAGPAANTGTVTNQPIDATSDAGIRIYRNIRLNNSSNPNIWSGAFASPVVVDNWGPGYGATTLTDLNNVLAQFVNPTIGAAAQTTADIAAAFEWKAGSIPSTFPKPPGPFAPKAVRMIDHARGTFKAEIMLP